jgi:hypothetical protein
MGRSFNIIRELAFESDVHKDVLAVITAGSYMMVVLRQNFTIRNSSRLMFPVGGYFNNIATFALTVPGFLFDTG